VGLGKTRTGELVADGVALGDPVDLQVDEGDCGPVGISLDGRLLFTTGVERGVLSCGADDELSPDGPQTMICGLYWCMSAPKPLPAPATSRKPKLTLTTFCVRVTGESKLYITGTSVVS
jgi:hypothetical protein